jgi:glycerol kinase
MFDMKWNISATNICRIPLSIMPELRSSLGDFGEVIPDLFGAPIPIKANCADQSAALFGECCFSVGDSKITAGTGCFLDINTGDAPIGSPTGLFPFVAWTIGNKTTYMIEGFASTIGTVINWSRNNLGIFEDAEDTSEIASSVPNTNGVHFVPTFGELQNDDGARGVIIGLSACTTKAHIVRAMLEGIAFSISDLMKLVDQVAILPNRKQRINGGLAQNDFLCQFLSDILNKPLDRPAHPSRSTAQGIIYMAGMASGVWNSFEELLPLRSSERIFTPSMSAEQRRAVVNGWRNATIRSFSPRKLRKMKKALWKQLTFCESQPAKSLDMNHWKEFLKTVQWARDSFRPSSSAVLVETAQGSQSNEAQESQSDQAQAAPTKRRLSYVSQGPSSAPTELQTWRSFAYTEPWATAPWSWVQ